MMKVEPAKIKPIKTLIAIMPDAVSESADSVTMAARSNKVYTAPASQRDLADGATWVSSPVERIYTTIGSSTDTLSDQLNDSSCD